MTIALTPELMRLCFPKGNAAVLRAFVDKQDAISEICENSRRLSFCFANIYAETGGITIPGLVEDIRYSAERMADVWWNRFPLNPPVRKKGDPAKVRAKYGTGPDWRRKAFNDIYGTRMGNRPGTNDGFERIGRGVPQVTGMDGDRAISKITGIDFVSDPAKMTQLDLQPLITQAFWTWKNLSPVADREQIVTGRKLWNGGDNGLDVVQKEYRRIKKIIDAYQPKTVVPNVQPVKADRDDELMELQAELKALGYFEIGDEDGRIGGRTTGGIKAFFIDRGIAASSTYPESKGILTAEIEKAKAERWHRPIAPGRAYATETDVGEKVSSIAPAQSAGFFAKIGAWFSGGATVVSGAVKIMPDVSDEISPYKYFIQEWFPSFPTILFMAVIAAIAIYTVRQISKSKQATVDDYQTGKIN